MPARVLLIRHHEGSDAGTLAAPLTDAGAEFVDWPTWQCPEPPAALTEIDGVVALGGLMNPDDDDDHPFIAHERELLGEACARGVPTLAICLGAQLLAQATGGDSRSLGRMRFGWHQLETTTAYATDALCRGTEPPATYHWHAYECHPPADAITLATCDDTVQAFRIGDSAWGVQFHPEVTPAMGRLWIERGRGRLIEFGHDPDDALTRSESCAGASADYGATLAARFAALVTPGRRGASSRTRR